MKKISLIAALLLPMFAQADIVLFATETAVVGGTVTNNFLNVRYTDSPIRRGERQYWFQSSCRAAGTAAVEDDNRTELLCLKHTGQTVTICRRLIALLPFSSRGDGHWRIDCGHALDEGLVSEGFEAPDDYSNG